MDETCRYLRHFWVTLLGFNLSRDFFQQFHMIHVIFVIFKIINLFSYIFYVTWNRSVNSWSLQSLHPAEIQDFFFFSIIFHVVLVEERDISRDLFVVTSKMPNRHVPQINQATAELHRNCRATVRPQRNWPQQSSDGKMMGAPSLTS